jgi:RNA polymerase sporulation-specific sigma factor
LKTFPKPLTAQEEKLYLKKYAQGDQSARDILIERNLRLVAHVARKYPNAEEDLEDLISIGTIGLIKAVSTFDPSKNNRLATYAARCIDNELLMMMRAKKEICKGCFHLRAHRHG